MFQNNSKNLICLSILQSEVDNYEDFNIKEIDSFYRDAKAITNLDELVVLQKCNCTELYLYCESGVESSVIKLWQKSSLNSKIFDKDNIKTYFNDQCVEHLLKTATGLKSVVVGDNQVLGQVANASKKSISEGFSKKILSTLFGRVKESANMIRNNTQLSSGNTSVPRIATDLFLTGNPSKDISILIIGAGEIAEILAKSLSEKKFTNITIANRTSENALKIVNKGYANGAISLEKAYKRFDNYPIIFTAIAAPIDQKISRSLRFYKEIKIYDLGNPRNTAYFPKKLKIITISDIHLFAEKILKNRLDKIKAAEKLVSNNTKIILNYLNDEEINLEIRNNYKTSGNHINADFIKNYQIKNIFIHYIREFLYKNNFVEVNTPCVIAVPPDPVKSGPEKEIFDLDWYGRKLFLRQSNQLHKQMLILDGFDKIYEIGPIWRSEKKFTKRHLAEAWVLDIEMLGIKKPEELIKFMGLLLNKITTDLSLKKLIKRDKIIDREIRTITYKKAVELLKIDKIPYAEGTDFGYEIEQKLGNIIKQKYNTDIFAILRYPDSIKKFYTKSNKHITETFDIFYCGWEISSGAIRQDNYIKLKKALSDAGLNVKKYDFYLEKFKKSKPHGGFCLGYDRLIAKLLGYENISEITLYPRDKFNIVP